MAATQFGTPLALGATGYSITLPNAANYYVESATIDGDVDMEVTNDADGAPLNIAVYNKHPKVDLVLICQSAAAPATDFPVGTNIDTTWFVNSAPVTKTKSPWRVALSVTNIGIS